MKKMFGMCMNWKVIAALATVAVGLFVFLSPAMALAAVPFLLIAICPLSMLVMMKTMGNMRQNAHPGAATGTQVGAATAGGAQQSPCCTSGKPLSKEEQVAQLQVQLRDMQAQQERLGAQLAQLETPAPTPYVATVKASN